MLKLKIPASTSNLGAGFDTLGLALGLYNYFTFEASDELVIECADPAHQTSDNLVYQSFCHTLKSRGKELFNVRIIIDGDVPIARGLGSSSTCILAGIVAADKLGKLNLSEAEIIEIATELEGHPDNAVPCYKGGFTAAFQDKGKVYYQVFTPPKPLNLVAFVPDFELSTKKSRAVLPQQISYADAVFNFGRLAYLLSALTSGDYSALDVALDDKVHQPYRVGLIKGGLELIKALQDEKIGAFISGAGPTIMAMTDRKIDIEKFANYGFNPMPLVIDTKGVTIQSIC